MTVQFDSKRKITPPALPRSGEGIARTQHRRPEARADAAALLGKWGVIVPWHTHLAALITNHFLPRGYDAKSRDK